MPTSPIIHLDIKETDPNAVDVEGDSKNDRITLDIRQGSCSENLFYITAYTSLAQDGPKGFEHYQLKKTTTDLSNVPPNWHLSEAKVEGARSI